MRSKKHKKKHLIIFSAVLIFSLIILIVGTYIIRKTVRNYIVKMIVNVVSKATDSKIKYSEVHGNLISGIQFDNFSMIAKNDINLYSDFVKLRYNIVQMMRKNLYFDDVFIKNLRLQIKTKEKKGQKPSSINLLVRKGEIKGGKIIINNDSVYIRNLTGKIKVEKSDFHINLQNATGIVYQKRKEINVKKFLLKLRKNKDSLQFNSLYVELEHSIIKAEGFVSENDWLLKIKNSRIYFADFSIFDGSLELSGELQNIKNNLIGSIKGTVKNGRYKDYIIPALQFRMSGLKDTLITAMSGDGFLLNSVLSIRDTSFDAKLSLADFKMHNMYRKLNKTITLSGEITCSGKMKKFYFSALIPQLEIDNKMIDTIFIAGEKNKKELAIDSLHIGKKNQYIIAYGNIRKNGLDIYLLADKMHLDMFQFMFPMKGILDGNIRITGILHNPSISGNFYLRNFAYSDISTKKIEGEFNKFYFFSTEGTASLNLSNIKYKNIKIDSSFIVLDNKKLYTSSFSGVSFLKTEGIFRRTDDELTFHNTEIKLNIWGNRITGLINITKKQRKIEIDTLFLSGKGLGKIEAKGSYENKIPSINLIVEEFDLSILKNTLGNNVTGLFSFQWKTDTISSFNFTVSDISYKDITLDRVKGKLLLNNEVLTIDTIRISNKGHLSYIYGDCNVYFNKKVKVKNMNITMNINNIGVWIFRPLKKYIDVKKGNEKAEIKIRGDMKKPRFSGIIRVSNTYAYIPPIKNYIENGYFLLMLKNDKILISDSSHATVGRGTLKGNGYIKPFPLNSITGDLFFKFQKVPASPMKDIFATTTGNLEIRIGKNTTDINGDIYVNEGLITYELTGNGTKTKSTSSENSNSITNYNLNISGDNNIWFRNKYMDVELRGKFTYKEKGRRSSYQGKLEVIRGFIYYMGHTLKITRGALSFPNVSTINPHFNIWAELPTREIYVSKNNATKVTIILHLSGTLNNPEFDFISKPPVLTQSDIIAYLNLNVTMREMQSQNNREFVYEAFSNAILSMMGREVSRTIKEYTGIDYISIEMQEENNPEIKLGKYLGERLFISYSHSLKNINEDEIKVEYYLGKGHEIVGEKNKENKINIMYRYKVRF